MAVGFVNSMMMKLRQALAVIMGAVIGTSITGWLIALGGVGGSGGSAALQLLSTEGISAISAIAGILMRMICKLRKGERLYIGGIIDYHF
jgi:phosphate:Na+ symporter